MHEKIKLFIRDTFLILLLYFVLFITLFFSTDISNGVRDGIDLTINFIVPSLFIFMILSSCIVNSSLSRYFALPFKPLFTHILHMPNKLTTITLLSLIGGYPIGAKLISEEVKKGLLSSEDATLMMAFCVNCGPAFLITGVGTKLLNSPILGLCLYLSQIAACLIIAFFITRKHRLKYTSSIDKLKFTSDTFISAVSDNTLIIVKISAYVIVFSAFFPTITSLIPSSNEALANIVKGLLEVTNGCNSIFSFPAKHAILMLAVFTGFGGICVHMQIYSIIKPQHISMKMFYLFRPLYIAISCLVCKLLCVITPNASYDCISINRDIPKTAFSKSPQVFIFMFLLIIILLFFTKKSDKIEV